jgi:asparagine synthase (glutamine-hydrolysing)
LIELAARIPPKHKIRGFDEKHILKKAFADMLPPAIATRPKQPYRAPIAASLKAGQNNLGVQLLEKRELERAGLTDVAAVEKLLAKCASGTALGEREEMGLALITSLQLVNHSFVGNFASTMSSMSAAFACR